MNSLLLVVVPNQINNQKNHKTNSKNYRQNLISPKFLENIRIFIILFFFYFPWRQAQLFSSFSFSHFLVIVQLHSIMAFLLLYFFFRKDQWIVVLRHFIFRSLILISMVLEKKSNSHNASNNHYHQIIKNDITSLTAEKVQLVTLNKYVIAH